MRCFLICDFNFALVEPNIKAGCISAEHVAECNAVTDAIFVERDCLALGFIVDTYPCDCFLALTTIAENVAYLVAIFICLYQFCIPNVPVVG